MFTLIGNSAFPAQDLGFFKYQSLVNFISTDSTSQCSFVVSCTKLFNFESSAKPDVITFFRNNGFSDAQISKIIGKVPQLSRCIVDKTLKPKFDFFNSQGISGSDLVRVLSDPIILTASLERKIIPYFCSIKSIAQTDAKLVAMLKRASRVLMQDPQKDMVPNVALLQEHGVPADNIAKLLVSQPLAFLKPTSVFSEIVEEVEKMKFDPSQYLFLVAIHALTCMSRSSLEAKFDIYRRWGLSEDEIHHVFRKNPRCMMISEKNIMNTMNYFVNEIGYTHSLIVKQPNVIMFSLKRRIIPRCSVIEILKAKGLVRKNRSLDVLMQLPEDVFLKKYVIEFEKEVPELLTLYQGKGRIMI